MKCSFLATIKQLPRTEISGPTISARLTAGARFFAATMPAWTWKTSCGRLRRMTRASDLNALGVSQDLPRPATKTFDLHVHLVVRML